MTWSGQLPHLGPSSILIQPHSDPLCLGDASGLHSGYQQPREVPQSRLGGHSLVGKVGRGARCDSQPEVLVCPSSERRWRLPAGWAWGARVVVSAQQVFLGSLLRFCTLSSETFREDANGPTGSFAESRPWRQATGGGQGSTVGRCPSSRHSVYPAPYACRFWARAESQADTAPAPRRPTCGRDRGRGGGLRSCFRPGGGDAEEGAQGVGVGGKGLGRSDSGRDLDAGGGCRVLGPVGDRHARWAWPAGDVEAWGSPRGWMAGRTLARFHRLPSGTVCGADPAAGRSGHRLQGAWCLPGG